jgi:hypothetical protein
VREDLTVACVALVQQFIDAKQIENAASLRDRFIKGLNVPADRFPKF